MDYEKLEQLKRLHDSGALNDEEFEKEKKKILDEEATATAEPVLPWCSIYRCMRKRSLHYKASHHPHERPRCYHFPIQLLPVTAGAGDSVLKSRASRRERTESK